MKYILYCRKSTDTEDRQVLSLDSQEKELLAIAEKLNLKIVKVFKESRTAKEAGRPIFNEVIQMINAGKADAILCWKLDRLARNFLDGGLIMDMLQKGVIKEIHTYEAVHLPNETSFILAMQFGMANQYSRDLSVNVKRGNREKLARGEWPNHAPFGYLNDKPTKTIIIDPIRSKYVVRAFQLYATGRYGFNEIAKILYEEGLRTSSGKKVYRGHIHRFISQPFYCGLMLREGKYYPGKHQPLISKQLFDDAQNVLHNRNRPRLQKKFFALRGFLKCENCGCAYTASTKKGHDYYYCTNGKGHCEAHLKYMRETKVYDLIAPILDKVKFDEEIIDIMFNAAKERQLHDNSYVESIVTSCQNRLESLKAKETRLLDTFLDGQISKEIYDAKVLEIHNEKICAEKQMSEAKTKNDILALEPTKEAFLLGNRAMKSFVDGNDDEKRIIASKILWNLSMKDGNIAQVSYRSPYDIMAKAPKTGDIKTLLRDLDSNQDNKLQRLVSYH